MRSIRTKLAIIIIVSVACSVLVASLSSAWYEARRHLESKREEIGSIAIVLAATVAVPLSNSDRTGVARALGAIGRMKGLSFVRVSNRQGLTVHEWGLGVVVARSAARLGEDGGDGLIKALFLGSYTADAPIVLGGEQIGTLTLIADLSEMRGEIIHSLMLALFTGLLATLVGLALGGGLQRRIVGPVKALQSAMEEVRRSKDFSAKVERTSSDEIGALVDAFNAMLAEIRSRDAELDRHRQNLQRKVEERTAELAQAMRAAEQANAAKSDFLATMSHEIRTPLNGMLVTAELLASSGLPMRMSRHADAMVRSGQHLLTIINDILDLSKIEAGRIELEAVPVSPGAVIEDVLRLFSDRARAKGLDLSGRVAAGVPSCIASDPVRLAQVLSNLVSNALKFTERGKVTVSARTLGVKNGREVIELAVADTGAGIAPDKVNTIFEAFSQADQSTTRKFGGTGIGLTICRKIVELMGGSIDVLSVVGRGSTFIVTIPVDVLDASLLPESEDAVAAPALAANAGLAGARVLAADDSEVNREVLVEALARLGIEVVAVSDGRAAVAALEQDSFDLVFMDGSMPEMDGFEATRAIRARERDTGRRRVPIVAMTAHVVGGKANAWQDAGMDDCVTKPYTLATLRSCLERWLSGRDTSRSGGGAEERPANADDGVRLLDPAVLSDIREMQRPGDDLAARVIALYREHAPRALATLGERITSGEAKPIADAAHALKSLSRNIGAVRVAELCAQLERAARGGETRDAARLQGAIAGALTDTLAALDPPFAAAV